MTQFETQHEISDFLRGFNIGRPAEYTKEPERTWDLFVSSENLGLDALDANVKHLSIHGEDIKTKLTTWAARPDRTLYMWGPPGCGKTYAGLSIMRQVFHQYKYCWMRYLDASRITEMGKREGSHYLKDRYGDCALLLIDDLGVDQPADWEKKYTFDLIEERCQKKRLPTIVTANVSKTELAKIVTERVVSRLVGCEIEFKSRDLR